MRQADPDERTEDGAAAADAGALHALLGWYLAMGVDAAVSEEARDAFSALKRQTDAAERTAAMAHHPRAAPQPQSANVHSPPGSPQSAEAAIRRAEELAAAADSLEALAAAWSALPGCDLAGKSSGMIFSGGRAGAELMLVGGAPDSEDERCGQAFADAKGRLLDAMLLAIGRQREDSYLANVVPWRPPGNRVPTPLELSLCLPFARRQIALARPRLLLCLGERAAQPLLGSREPVSRLRGRWLRCEAGAGTVKTLVTFPLDYLLKQPLAKRRAWSDLQMVAEALGGSGR